MRQTKHTSFTITLLGILTTLFIVACAPNILPPTWQDNTDGLLVTVQLPATGHQSISRAIHSSRAITPSIESVRLFVTDENDELISGSPWILSRSGSSFTGIISIPDFGVYNFRAEGWSGPNFTGILAVEGSLRNQTLDINNFAAGVTIAVAYPTVTLQAHGGVEFNNLWAISQTEDGIRFTGEGLDNPTPLGHYYHTGPMILDQYNPLSFTFRIDQEDFAEGDAGIPDGLHFIINTDTAGTTLYPDSGFAIRLNFQLYGGGLIASVHKDGSELQFNGNPAQSLNGFGATGNHLKDQDITVTLRYDTSLGYWAVDVLGDNLDGAGTTNFTLPLWGTQNVVTGLGAPADLFSSGASFRVAPFTGTGMARSDFTLKTVNGQPVQATFPDEPVIPEVGTAYYINQSHGDNTNTGTSPEHPWKDFTNLETMVLQPGDRVLLRRGDTWNSRMTLRGKGSENHWIYVGPYGDLSDSMPTISLDNHRDDIAIVVQDLINDPGRGYNAGLGYIHIDNLKITNTRMGIYFRNVLSSEPVGFKVTDMHFQNILQMDVTNHMARRYVVGSTTQPLDPPSPNPSATYTPGVPTTELAFFDAQADYEVRKVKGNLDLFEGSYSSTGGGSTEYVFPTAIFFGGRRATGDARIGFSDIEIDNILMEDTFFGIGGDFLYNPDTNRKFYQNIRVTNVTLDRGQTIFGFTNVDYGNPTRSPSNRWGVFTNLNIVAGREDFLFAGGTTGGFAERASNGYFAYNNFSNVQNGGTNPPDGFSTTADGCGFDFEGDTRNIILEKSIFANNTGQGILIMQGSRPHNEDLLIRHNLFYNNLLTPMDSNNYRWDITIWNDNNINIRMENNRHVHRNMTDGGVRPGNYVNRTTNSDGAGNRGFGFKTYSQLIETGATFFNFTKQGGLPNFQTEVNNKGLQNALLEVTTSTLNQRSYTSP